MNQHEGSDSDEGEISFLDLMVAVAESWVLLVAGTVIAAVLGYAVAAFQPVSYQISAVIALPLVKVEGLYATGAPFTVSQATIEFESEEPVDGELALIGTKAGGATRITLAASSATSAQEKLLLLLAVYNNTVGDALVEEQEVHLQTQLAETRRRTTENEAASERIRSAIDRIEAEPRFDGAAFAELANLQQRLRNELYALAARVGDLQARLNKLPTSLVISPPDIPTAVNGRSPYLIGALSGGAVGFMLLLLVFARQGVRSAKQDPEGEIKTPTDQEWVAAASAGDTCKEIQVT